MDEENKKFKQLLDDYYEWPTPYLYKFVLPRNKLTELELIFPFEELKVRPSSKGHYVSVSLIRLTKSSEEIIEIYRKVSQIEGTLIL